MAEAYELLAGNVIVGTYNNGELNIVNKQLAPLFVTDFREWVESRSLSQLRGLTARNIKRSSGLTANSSAYETALKANCACVTDNYWIREIGSSLTYEDVNYDSYDGSFAPVALGISSRSSDSFLYDRHPELTNIGNSDKAWVIDDDGIRWLQKRQTFRECLNEMLASKIAKALGINTVEYEIVSVTDPDPEEGRQGIIRSKDFTQGKNINLEHAEFILKHFGITEDEIEANAKIFNSYGCVKDYLDIKYLDILTGNPDRHSRNYGLLRSRETGEVIGLAPNFDNNFAFRDDLSLNVFSEVASKYEYVPPALTEADIQAITSEMNDLSPNYNIKGILDSVSWKQRSIAKAIEKNISYKKDEEYNI